MLNYQLSNFPSAILGFNGISQKCWPGPNKAACGASWRPSRPLEFWGIDVECNLQKKIDIVKSVPETVMHHFGFFLDSFWGYYI